MKNKRFFDFENSLIGWEKNSYKGIYKVKFFFRNLKWAFQRFFRGYDDRMFWCLNDYIKQHMVIGLRWYVENNMFCYPKPQHLWKDDNIEFYTGEETENILRKIIKHLILSDEDIAEKYLYGSQWNEIPKKEQDFKQLYAFMKKNHNKAFDLLREYYSHLWW